MTTVLAAIDGNPIGGDVLAVAGALAGLTGAELRVLHVMNGNDDGATRSAERAGIPLEQREGDPIEEIIRVCADPEITVVVVGGRAEVEGATPTGHVARSIIERAGDPVLVVPPRTDDRGTAPQIRRALIPLEGTAETSAAVTEALHQLVACGVELVALHVFDANTVPAFWDQSAYADEVYAAEFASRWCAESPADLHLRRGSPAETVIEVAEQEAVDLIALGWSQDLGPGRAAVVRSALADAGIPVLLVPVTDADRDSR